LRRIGINAGGAPYSGRITGWGVPPKTVPVETAWAIEALQALMNHSRIDTTQVYLRALNRSQAMEKVRDLSWGLGFQAEGEEAHTGFEPVLPENAGGKPDSGSRGQIAPGSELNPHLRAVLERLKERDRERRR
jgi:hypothetical protein